MQIDEKIIEAAARALNERDKFAEWEPTSHLATMYRREAHAAIAAALAAGLREQIRAEAIREAADAALMTFWSTIGDGRILSRQASPAEVRAAILALLDKPAPDEPPAQKGDAL
jgi:hypothetical protein